ncbi:MAG: M17 family metallopeptidase [Alphaproteobacteria bacterium]
MEQSRIDALTDQTWRDVVFCGEPSQKTHAPLYLVRLDHYDSWLETLAPSSRNQLARIGSAPECGRPYLVYDGWFEDKPYILAGVLVYQQGRMFEHMAMAAPKLPAESFYPILIDIEDAPDLAHGALGFALSCYGFDYFKSESVSSVRWARLILADEQSVTRVNAIAQATYLGRDMVNMPADILTPEAMGRLVGLIAAQHDASISEIVGESLLEQNFPLIYHVGKAASSAPRLIELNWQPKSQNHKVLPCISLVGKGVTFDSGGLDIKPSNAMKLMKKDMAGAASALSLAVMIMRLNLPVQLKLLIPAVENAISGNAFRPLDILPSRKGTYVEIGDTDAEGRLILADAISYACEQKCDLLVDFATLTGAARVALGTDLPALFCNDSVLAADIMDGGLRMNDPCWQLPLYDPYRKQLKGKAAPLNNAPASGVGGAITAALFIEHFVDPKVKWAHIDMMGWNLANRPAYPEGGEPHMVRAFLTLIEEIYCHEA